MKHLLPFFVGLGLITIVCPPAGIALLFVGTFILGILGLADFYEDRNRRR